MPDAFKTDVRIPALETDRLRLRGHTIGDLEACLAIWSDPEVVRFIGGRPNTRDEVWSRILRYIGQWAALGYGFWAIEDKASGELIGEICFADFQRGLAGSFGEDPEMGWTLAPWAQGKGYASEALAAALAWGATHLPAKRYVCMIHPDNAPSLRLAERFGFRAYDRAEFKGSPAVLLERLRA